MDNTTDALLTELKNINIQPVSPVLSTTTTMTSAISGGPSSLVLTEDNLSEFILKHSQELIQTSLFTLGELKDIVGKTFDGKLITSYADILKATTGALDTLNAIQIEKSKQKTAKEIKQMDIESRKTLKAPSKVVNNNVLVATREEIFKMLEQDNNLNIENPIESKLVAKE
jgi:hypothetical protein